MNNESNVTASIATLVNETANNIGKTALNMFICTLGIAGNLLVLFILNRTWSSSNRTHRFIQCCLATNNFIALTGIFTLKMATLIWDDNLWLCRAFVLTRFFGLGSGCVAIVMAVQRLLAVTTPFFYQKYVSFRLLVQVITILWLIALCLVCLPFFGFGRYWDEKKSKCMHYRNAQEPLDKLYANMFLSFGVFLCVVIVFSNLAVIIAMCKKNYFNKKTISESQGSSWICNETIKKEKIYGGLVLLSCILFVLCWAPQMVLVSMTLHAPVKFEDDKKMSSISKMMLAIYFTLNPYVYLLGNWTLVKSIVLRVKSCEEEQTIEIGSTNVSRTSSVRVRRQVSSRQPLYTISQ